MAKKAGKKVKRKGVARLVKVFLKRKSAAAKTPIKKVTQKRKPVVKKAPVIKTAQLKKSIVKKPVSAKRIQKQEKAKDTPFISEKPQVAGPKYFFHTDVPDTYNDTYMRALPRDPEWLFVYWEISEGTRNEVKNRMGEAAYNSSKKILRLCDVTDINYDGGNAQHYTDIEINDYANNWYIRVPQAGRSYIVECGFLTPDGKFILGVRSNAVAVPAGGLSGVSDKDWAASDELLRMSAEALKRGMGASEKRLSSGSGSGGIAGGRF